MADGRIPGRQGLDPGCRFHRGLCGYQKSSCFYTGALDSDQCVQLALWAGCRLADSGFLSPTLYTFFFFFNDVSPLPLGEYLAVFL